MKYGVRDQVLRQSWESVFGDAAWLGFNGVELDIGASFEDTLLWNDDGRRRLRQMQAGTGMDLAAFCLGGLWTTSPADADPEVRARALRLMQEAIGHSRTVECSVILVPITPGHGHDRESQRSLWIDALRQCAATAEEAQVCLAIENVGSGCAQSAREMLSIVQPVASPMVQTYYDVGNAVAFGEDPVQEIHLLKGQIRQLHAKECGGDRLGTGRVPYAEIVTAVQQIGYDGYIVLETDPTTDPHRAAADNLHFLQGIFS